MVSGPARHSYSAIITSVCTDISGIGPNCGRVLLLCLTFKAEYSYLEDLSHSILPPGSLSSVYGRRLKIKRTTTITKIQLYEVLEKDNQVLFIPVIICKSGMVFLVFIFFYFKKKNKKRSDTECQNKK